MVAINELTSLQNNIIRFYTEFMQKKRVNIPSLIDSYLKEDKNQSILLLNLKSEYNNLERAYNLILQTFSHKKKRETLLAVKANKKTYPELSEALLTGFNFLARIEVYTKKLLKIVYQEIKYAQTGNKEELRKAFIEEISLQKTIGEKNKAWYAKFNQCAAKLKKNKNIKEILGLRSERGAAGLGSLGMIVSIFTFIVTYHQMTKYNIGNVGSDALLIGETMAKDGLLAGLIGLILFGVTIALFKKE